MVVGDRTVEQGLRAGQRVAARGGGLSLASPDLVPLAVTAAILGGLAIAVATTPIGSGDYGQWLMTSRWFLGETVPDYRALGEVPPVVPLLIAGARLAVGDPLAALQVVTTLLVVLAGIGLYAAGAGAFASRWAGVAAVVIGLLVTEQFTELIAFGGLLQVASLAFLCLAVASFARAARPSASPAWWWAAAAALGLSALTHVGTGLIAVPVGLVVGVLAGAAGLRESLIGTRRVITRLVAPAILLGAVGLFWLLVLVGGSTEYVTNPASLGYRGPDRLFAELLGQWPNAIVIVVGAGTLVIGSIRSLLRREVNAIPLVAAWATVTWGILAYALVTGSATDYPRFATPLMAPLVVGAAGALVAVSGAVATAFRRVRPRGRALPVAGIVAVAGAIVAGPLAVDRYAFQAEFYELRDPAALTAAAAWTDAALPAGQAVLADPRDGKWIEGLTGRPALFSHAVRYAFRPAEWQRSADADAMLRSTATLTSGYMAALFTGLAGPAVTGVPAGLLVRANHGGELVDVLRMPPASIALTGPGDDVTAAALVPVRATERSSDRQASLRTVWMGGPGAGVEYTQTITAFREGTTLQVSQTAPGRRIGVELTPAVGMAFTSLELSGGEARACFTRVGRSEPCLRIHVPQADARLAVTVDGDLRIRGGRSGQLDILVTALTAGDAAIGLGILDPARVASDHDVGAAILYAEGATYQSRRARLERIGFSEAEAFGPYRVLLRDGGRLR